MTTALVATKGHVGIVGYGVFNSHLSGQRFFALDLTQIVLVDSGCVLGSVHQSIEQNLFILP